MHRDFKGIWIPKSIWLNGNLNITEKAFLAEIDSLGNNGQGCFASNNHFKKFSKLSRTRCSEIIKSLNEKGFISIHYIRDGEQIKKRIIKVVDIPKGGSRESERLSRYPEGGSRESLKRENQYRNTVSNTEEKGYSPAVAAPPLPYQEIIDYLNQKAGTKYRSTTKKTQSLIKARYHEKFTLDDFKKVIDNKVAEWKSDNEMAKYLRPETLFGTKFESYLNQKEVGQHQSENPLYGSAEEHWGF